MMLYVLAIAVYALFVIGFWQIFRRIGWPQWPALLAVLPLGLLILFAILAFRRWPIEDHLARVEDELSLFRYNR